MTPHDKVVEMCGNFDEKSKADLAIRAERQRERASKWRERCNQLERTVSEQRSGYEQRIAELVGEIQKMNTEFNKNIDVLKKDSFEDHQKIRRLNGEKIDAYSRGHNEGREYAEKQYAREIRIGRREIANRRKERVNEKIDALMWKTVTGLNDNDELIGWVRRAIKRQIGAPSHVDVVIIEGSKKQENSPPKLAGHAGYHTTPSGKTIVTHPGAYKWRTVYHRSTEQVEVGREWVRKNIWYLAKSEAEMKIK